MKTYNKLVRDRIPEIIEADGASCKLRVLTDDLEYREALFAKLLEEAHEVVGAQANTKELVKEIGDVMEVLDAVAQSFGLDRAEIEAVKAERKASRGGFERKLFLEYTEEQKAD